MQTFDMKRSQPLPPLLLPYLRLAYATTHEQLDKVRQLCIVFRGLQPLHVYSLECMRVCGSFSHNMSSWTRCGNSAVCCVACNGS
jgi:hypothetical protein